MSQAQSVPFGVDVLCLGCKLTHPKGQPCSRCQPIEYHRTSNPRKEVTREP